MTFNNRIYVNLLYIFYLIIYFRLHLTLIEVILIY